MKKVIIAIVVLVMSFCFSESVFSAEIDGKYIVLDVEGEGSNRNEAVEQAWLSGIRQAVGSFIDAKTELNNEQLTERIVSYSRGLVEKYEVISVDESKVSQGIYKLKMRLWIVQDLLRDGAKHAASGSAEIAFSPADLKRKAELDAQAAKALEAKNAAAETSKTKSETAAELLETTLNRYKPEDFLSCYIPGKPEAVKGKTDTFSLSVELNFNEKLYKENFVPDLVKVLDQIASSKKNTLLVKFKNQLRDLAAKKDLPPSEKSVIIQANENEKDFTLFVYNRPERFGCRVYGFKDDVSKINDVLDDFIERTRRFEGISLELLDEEKEVIETIEQKFNLQFLLTEFGGKFAVHPSILREAGNRKRESTKITVPVELELPEEIIPFVKNIKASLLFAPELSKEEKEKREKEVIARLLGFEVEETLSGAGVKITRVNPNSEAAKRARITAGGILTEINNTKISNLKEFYQAMEGKKKGEKVYIKIIYSTGPYTYGLTLGE